MSQFGRLLLVGLLLVPLAALTFANPQDEQSNRIQKTLEGANIKLGDVASDILGVSARRMLEALIGGTTDPAVLADLAKDKLRKKIPHLERALKGQFDAHHRFLLAQQFAHLDGVDEPADRVLIQSFRAIPMGSIPSFAHHPASSRERWRSRW